MTSQAEDELASFLKKVAKIGCGKTKWEVLLIVQKTLEQKGNKPEKFGGEMVPSFHAKSSQIGL